MGELVVIGFGDAVFGSVLISFTVFASVFSVSWIGGFLYRKVAFMNKPFTIKLAAGTYLTSCTKLFGA